MKRWILLVFALAACTNTGNNTVNFPNIFGLDGLDITLGCASPCTDLNLIRFSGNFTDLPLNDLPENSPKIPEFYWGIPPLKVLESLGFETIMTATSETGTQAKMPTHFEVVTSQLELKITDGSGNPSLSKTFTSAGDLVIVYTLDECSTELSPITCTYTTDFSDPLLNLEIKGTETTIFYNQIWTDGESPNPVSGSFDITFKGDKFPPSDTEVSYTLVSSNGKLEF